MLKKMVAIGTVFCFAFCFCKAQKSYIHGTVFDSSNQIFLEKAVIKLLSIKDSTVIKETKANQDGFFEIPNLINGQYILFVSYPQYIDHIEIIKFVTASNTKICKINLLMKTKLLPNVIVQNHIDAVQLKGDTTEFLADSFKLKSYNNFEKLLKNIPGIDVDNFGNLLFYGEKIQSFLLDGVEMSAGISSLITHNLPADVVTKIQIFNKKNDQDAFSDIDDVQNKKGINIILKNSKKNNNFGEITSGLGSKGIFDTQISDMVFRDKKKVIAFASGSNSRNVSQYDLGLNDFGNSLTNTNYGELDTWNGSYEGQGIPLLEAAGVQFNNSWDSDKQSINSNYKIKQLRIEGENSNNIIYVLPDTTFNIKQDAKYINQIFQNKINVTYNFKSSVISSFKVTANAGFDQKINNNYYNSEYRNIYNTLVNSSNRKTTDTGSNKGFDLNILWLKKFKKEKRSISLSIKETNMEALASGHLYDKTDFYNNALIINSQLTNQLKKFKNANNILDVRFIYNERISKVSSLILNFKISKSRNTSQKYSFNQAQTGVYDLLDSLNSNTYILDKLINNIGLIYDYTKSKLKVKVGTNIGYTNYIQKNWIDDSITKRKFIDLYPQASISFQISRQKNVILRYNGSTSQPSIYEMQPLHNNNNPLNIIIGNPDLKPSFNNNISFEYSNYNLQASNNFHSLISYNLIQNKISNNVVVDSNGKSITRYVNLNGNNSIYGNFTYELRLKKQGIRLTLSSNVSRIKSVMISNYIQNVTKTDSYNQSIGGVKYFTKNIYASVFLSATYTSSVSTIQSNLNTQYWMYFIQSNCNINLPLKFEISIDENYNLQQRTKLFTSNNKRLLLNISVNKRLLKNDAIVIKALCNDLLNQATGIERAVSDNMVSQGSFNTIGKYFNLSFNWHFYKNK